MTESEHEQISVLAGRRQALTLVRLCESACERQQRREHERRCRHQGAVPLHPPARSIRLSSKELGNESGSENGNNLTLTRAPAVLVLFLGMRFSDVPGYATAYAPWADECYVGVDGFPFDRLPWLGRNDADII